MRYENGPGGLVKYHTVTEYGREVPASNDVFRFVIERSDHPLPTPSSRSLSIRYGIPSQEADSALESPLELQASTGDLSDDALAHFPPLLLKRS
ncbi:hypothetical protein EVAR_23210_1 [Eumeta japonica]|uniref:Uncharacterized protein n=1 Tax=Eumeta variegata TaxID=151549 RepID=A0A4C1VCN9_EUMVA|nr:hypothetical protein EVAR_23210_1 [Eumeta japonica]